jgi:hypothetical protein
MRNDEKNYGAYLRSIENLTTLRQETFDPSRHKIEDFIAEESVGETNSVYDLQNYVIGPSNSGFTMTGSGSLNLADAFSRLDYFSLLTQLKTRNNLQESVASRPVDFIAMSVPVEALRPALPESLLPIDIAIWLFRDADTQALILGRRDGDGQSWLRYLPVRRLTQDVSGRIHFSPSAWRDNLPLDLWEDLPLPADERELWLSSWHTESEWLHAVHTTKYSNAVISLYEQFTFPSALKTCGASELTDEDLILRFR